MSTRLTYEMDRLVVADRLAGALARIIDDPLVVKLLMFRDPEAWVEACEALSAAGYEPEDAAEAPD